MKKTGKFLLALGLFLSTGVTAFATDILGTDPAFDGTGSVRVNGLIGEFDPRDPNSEEPPITEWWIDLSLPTLTTFYSDQTNAPASLTNLESADYEIRNYSARGVDVSLEDFVVRAGTTAADFNMIGLLEVTSGSTSRQLIDAGTIDVADGLLMTIARSTGFDTPAFAPSTGVFAFEGLLSSIPTTAVNPGFDLVLSFEVNSAH